MQVVLCNCYRFLIILFYICATLELKCFYERHMEYISQENPLMICSHSYQENIALDCVPGACKTHCWSLTEHSVAHTLVSVLMDPSDLCSFFSLSLQCAITLYFAILISLCSSALYYGCSELVKTISYCTHNTRLFSLPRIVLYYIEQTGRGWFVHDLTRTRTSKLDIIYYYHCKLSRGEFHFLRPIKTSFFRFYFQETIECIKFTKILTG